MAASSVCLHALAEQQMGLKSEIPINRSWPIMKTSPSLKRQHHSFIRHSNYTHCTDPTQTQTSQHQHFLTQSAQASILVDHDTQQESDLRLLLRIIQIRTMRIVQIRTIRFTRRNMANTTPLLPTSKQVTKQATQRVHSIQLHSKF